MSSGLSQYVDLFPKVLREVCEPSSASGSCSRTWQMPSLKVPTIAHSVGFARVLVYVCRNPFTVYSNIQLNGSKVYKTTRVVLGLFRVLLSGVATKITWLAICSRRTCFYAQRWSVPLDYGDGCLTAYGTSTIPQTATCRPMCISKSPTEPCSAGPLPSTSFFPKAPWILR